MDERNRLDQQQEVLPSTPPMHPQPAPVWLLEAEQQTQQQTQQLRQQQLLVHAPPPSQTNKKRAQYMQDYIDHVHQADRKFLFSSLLSHVMFTFFFASFCSASIGC